MATSLTETATTATTQPTTEAMVVVQPPPGISSSTSSASMSSPTKGPQQRIMAFRTGNNNNGGGGGNTIVPANIGSMGVSSEMSYIRRAASTDDGNSNSNHCSLNHNPHANHNPTPSPWSNFDIFRTSPKSLTETGEPTQSRNESSQHRLHSHQLDPMLQADDDDSLEERCPQDRLADGNSNDNNANIFRGRLYSPIIGTPKRGLANWATEGKSHDAQDDTSWIPSIRPSLSCPTSVFESPLFPSSYSSHSLSVLGGVVGGRGSLRATTMLLSQPYPLEKITSVSADASPGDGDSLDGSRLMHSHLKNLSDGLNDEHGPQDGMMDDNGLMTADVSVIECDGEDSFSNILDAHKVNNNNPMRNLSDAFEMLVVDGDGLPLDDGRMMETASRLDGVPASVGGVNRGELMLANVSKSGETSSIKPSPTSVLGFESETTLASTASNSVISHVQLENGLTVAAISHPHFHLHDSLRGGELAQGVIDRVSFYSVVRDINKEACDAALTDPKGGVYNDGSVHGKQGRNAGASGAGAATASTAPLPPNLGGNHQVIAEDGKVHVHPNPKEERKSVLVMACLSDEKQNPNEPSDDNAPESQQHTTGNTKMLPPSLGAALLDEEWWLMSAIASRTPDEVTMNQLTKLLPTFFEAMGEKDGSITAESNTGASSRTQLWKPGRSWWEAKSGKNPWVEPVVHNNRWRYLWPLIHYHKFIAKCIKKLKRNGIDVKSSTSNVSLFLRQEVCNVSDHLAFMSKYDSEEWTSALSHFDGWTDHDPNVEETLRALVASQELAGVEETADFQSSLLRGQIDDQILKAMQAAKDEAGRDAYDYKDVPAQHIAKKDTNDESASSAGGSSTQQHAHSAQDNSFGRMHRTAAWANENHLRSAIESKKRTINDTSRSNRSQHHPQPPPYPHQDAYGRQFAQHPPPPPYGPPPGYGQGYGGAMNSQYYPPPHPPHPHQYDGYHGQYPPQHPHMGYHHPGDMSYNDQYGHGHHQYCNGYYHPADGSFHEGMVFDHSMHSQDPYMNPSMAQTPNRYHGGDVHQGQYPPSPYWGHLNISQLPGIAASPSIHITPSKPPRGSHPNRSFRKRQQHQGPQQAINGKAKSLIMFPNQTNSPASRFVMSPQDKSNPYYTTKNSQTTKMPNDNNAAPSSSSLNQSVGQEESFVLPTIEDYNPESPADRAAGPPSLSNTSMDLMPPSVKKMYMESSRRKLSDVSETP